jgi:hypothetical protein
MSPVRESSVTDYFLVHDRTSFETVLRPALAEVWRRRSFRCVVPLVPAWKTAALDYARRYQINLEEIFLLGFSPSLPFAPHLWRSLVGELLVVTAVEMPEIPAHIESSLAAVLVPGHDVAAEVPLRHLPPILQALRGSDDLTFGLATYRPEMAGYNRPPDVARLRQYLHGVEPEFWQGEALATQLDLADEEELAEELAFTRQWFAALVSLYDRLATEDRVMVFETVHG